MECRGCGNKDATRVRVSISEHGALVDVCNLRECGNLSQLVVKDVYFRKPYVDEHLGGALIHSKAHKAQVMRKLGVREDGDMYHGAREKGVEKKKQLRFTPKFKSKLDSAVRVAVRSANRRRP